MMRYIVETRYTVEVIRQIAVDAPHKAAALRAVRLMTQAERDAACVADDVGSWRVRSEVAVRALEDGA